MTLIGIDPGASTGIAVYNDGKLCELYTVAPWNIAAFIVSINPARVIYEDSRLTSPVWSRGTNAAQSIKIARNVGQVDAWCALIVATCADMGIPAHGISPKQKGAKLNAAAFEKLTGWQRQSNQHERDAAQVAWPYRGAVCNA